MALMIVIGTAGAWKIRTLMNSRQAAFRAIWPRTGANDPHPSGWRHSSTQMRFNGFNPAPFDDDPFGDHPVVRGPQVVATTGESLRVIDRTLDMEDGLRTGFARINRDLPIWRQLPQRNHFARDTLIFAGHMWQHDQMGVRNRSRRIPITYDYRLSHADPASAARAQRAAQQILASPHRRNMFVLDRDDELRTFWGDPYNGRPDRYDRLSAYPAARILCSIDPEQILRRQIDPLLNEIDGVPRRIAGLFLDMYRRQLAILDAAMPPPPGAAALRAELERKIKQLEDFIGSLP